MSEPSFESDEEVRLVVRDAGFEPDHVTVFGEPAQAGGRVLLATRPVPDS